LIICAASGVAVAPAAADPNKQVAHRAYAEGKKLYDVGEYQQALDAFKRAYLAYEDPSFLFNMAQCYRLVGDKQEATRAYKSYLRNFPQAKNRGDVKKIVADLEESLAKEREAAEAQARAADSPPQGTLAPEHVAAEASPAPTVEITQTPPPPKKSRAWIAGPVVGVIVAGVAVGLAVGLTVGRPAETTLTTVHAP
jgi:tetratricopeptide (TPR) repeat protein